MQTNIFRDFSGWRAESCSNFGPNKELVVETSKHPDGKLVSIVRAWSRSPSSKLCGHKLGQDFMKVFAVSHPNRITESVVTKQHLAVLANEAAMRFQAELFYKAQQSAENVTTA